MLIYLVKKSDPSTKMIYVTEKYKLLKKIQYKSSEFCKLKTGVHDSDVSHLSVLHEIHHVDIVALHNFLANSRCEIIVDSVRRYEDETKRPENSAQFAGESLKHG